MKVEFLARFGLKKGFSGLKVELWLITAYFYTIFASLWTWLVQNLPIGPFYSALNRARVESGNTICPRISRWKRRIHEYFLRRRSKSSYLPIFAPDKNLFLQWPTYLLLFLSNLETKKFHFQTFWRQIFEPWEKVSFDLHRSLLRCWHPLSFQKRSKTKAPKFAWVSKGVAQSEFKPRLGQISMNKFSELSGLV